MPLFGHSGIYKNVYLPVVPTKYKNGGTVCESTTQQYWLDSNQTTVVSLPLMVGYYDTLGDACNTLATTKQDPPALY